MQVEEDGCWLTVEEDRGGAAGPTKKEAERDGVVSVRRKCGVFVRKRKEIHDQGEKRMMAPKKRMEVLFSGQEEKEALKRRKFEQDKEPKYMELKLDLSS